MEKESYLQQKEAIESRITHEKELLVNLRKVYVESNSPYKIGQKVKIVSPPHPYWTFNGNKRMSIHEERFAYVDGYEIEYNGNVKPVLKKAKKDGSVSLQRDYYNQEHSYLEIV